MPNFPTRATELNSEWLTKVLRKSGVLDHGKVSGFTLDSVAEPGQTADLCRILLTYEGKADGAPASLVAKFPAAFAAARALAVQYDSYRNEVRFYQVFARDRELPIPRAYAAELDEQDGDFVLLLEDLSSARIGSLFRSSVTDVRTGLSQLARIHAEFWNDPVLDQHSFIRKRDDAPWNAMLNGVMAQIIPAAQGMYADQFSPSSLLAMETGLRVWDDVLTYSPDAMTLVHVDAHPKQMFFPTDALPRFALFDWQQPAKNLGANDVARLLVTGLSIEDRRAHEQELVAGYFAELCRLGVTGLTPERLWMQIKLANVFNFYINVIASLQTDVQILAAMAEAEGADWRVAMLGKVGAATDDWRVGEVLEAYAKEARASRAG